MNIVLLCSPSKGIINVCELETNISFNFKIILNIADVFFESDAIPLFAKNWFNDNNEHDRL